MAAPQGGRVAMLDPLAMATIANTSSALFNPAAVIGENYKNGIFGRNQLGIGEWFQDPNRPNHTTGTFTSSTPLVNGAAQTGSTIITDGWASGATTLKKGDVFTIGSVYSVNPLSYASTGRLQQFVVTADISDTTGAATISISPSIITSGQLQTVSASPADNAVITVLGATAAAAGTLATTVSPQSFVYHPDAFAFVMADLKKPGAGAEATTVRSKAKGFSIRMVEQYSDPDRPEPQPVGHPDRRGHPPGAACRADLRLREARRHGTHRTSPARCHRALCPIPTCASAKCGRTARPRPLRCRRPVTTWSRSSTARAHSR
jgi:hypothetical protein